MKFSEAINLFKKNYGFNRAVKIKTLGKRSYINVELIEKNEGAIFNIINSKGKSKFVGLKDWENCILRLNSLMGKDKFVPSNYTHSWKSTEGNPSMIFSPYIIALYYYLSTKE